MRSLIIAGLILANVAIFAQTQKRPQPAGGVIQGIVQSGNMPLPGVTVAATNFITNEKVTTSTDLNGQYQLKVPAPGAYILETSMAAFAEGVKEADVKDANQPERVDFELVLLSRSQQTTLAKRCVANGVYFLSVLAEFLERFRVTAKINSPPITPNARVPGSGAAVALRRKLSK